MKKQTYTIKQHDEVFFRTVLVRNMPGVTEISQAVTFKMPDDEKEEDYSSIIREYNDSGDGIFSLMISQNTGTLTYTQKILSSVMHNKPQNVCLSLLFSGMLHLKAVLYDFDIKKEAILCD